MSSTVNKTQTAVTTIPTTTKTTTVATTTYKTITTTTTLPTTRKSTTTSTRTPTTNFSTPKNTTTTSTRNNNTSSTQPNTTTRPVYTSTHISTSTNAITSQPEITESLSPSLYSTKQTSAQHGLSSQTQLAIGLPVAFIIAIIIAVIVGILIWRSWRKRKSSGSVVKTTVTPPPPVEETIWPDIYCNFDHEKENNSETRYVEMYSSVQSKEQKNSSEPLSMHIDQNVNTNYVNSDSFIESAKPDETYTNADNFTLNYEVVGNIPGYNKEGGNKLISSDRDLPNLDEKSEKRRDEIYSLANDACNLLPGNGSSSANLYFELEKDGRDLLYDRGEIDKEVKCDSRLEDVVNMPTYVDLY